jgi:U3 small nucleolar RNA-associated protein 22
MMNEEKDYYSDEEDSMISEDNSDDDEFIVDKMNTKRSKYDLPSKDEQLALQQTEILMKSNLLRLQVDEMLNEVRNEDYRSNSLTKWIEYITDYILKSPSKIGSSDILLTKKWLLKSTCKNEIVLDGYSQKSTSIHFKSPKKIEVIGSYKHHTVTSPFINVDIGVTMPKECFEERDILNHIYFDKRKLYLSAIAEALSKDETCNNISVCNLKGDSRKPILVIKPNIKRSKNITVRIFLMCPVSTFKLSQLRPSKNNVRPTKWMETLQKEVSKGGEQKMDAKSLIPTPNYNMAILEDLAMGLEDQIISKFLDSCPIAKDAIILLKVWLTQRSFRFDVDSMDSHSASMLVAYLIQSRRIGLQTTALGAFLIVLKLLADTDFNKTSLDFSSIEALTTTSNVFCASLNHPIVNQFKESIDYNAFWRLSKSGLGDLKEEATETLRILQNSDESSFQQSFLTSKTFFDRNDLFFNIPVQTIAESTSFENSEELDNGLCDLIFWQYVNINCRQLLETALGDRVSSIRTSVRHNSEENNNSRFSVHKSLGKGWEIVVGLVVNLERASNRIDRGPSAEESEAVSNFRSFWGNKSQLRRFNDGSIVEAVLWGDDSTSGGGGIRAESIIEDIVRFVLGRHLPHICGSAGSFVRWRTLRLLSALPSYTKNNQSDARLIADADSQTRHAVEALDSLRGILTSDLKGMPINIDTLSGISSNLRYTSVVSPISHPLVEGGKTFLKRFYGSQISLLVTPLVIVGVLESCGKWPTQEEAVEKLRSALLLRLSKLAMEQFQIQTVVHNNFIDIFYRGYIFRLRIVRHEDANKLPTSLQNLLPPSILSLHHHNIRCVQNQFPSFSHAVRLLSSWSSGHLLSGNLPHEALEVLTASVYLDPTTRLPPSTSSSAFLRTLRKFAEWDWENSPLIVDYGKEISSSDRSSIITNFRSKRSQDKLYAPLFIVTSVESIPNFTSSLPESVLLPSIIGAARCTLEKVKAHFHKSSLDDLQVPNLSNYLSSDDLKRNCNLILKFNRSIVLPNSSKSTLEESCARGAPFARSDVFANIPNSSMSHKNLKVLDYLSPNPLQEEVIFNLREKYGHFALFFWNCLDGRDIGVVWRPNAFLPSTSISTLQMKYRIPTHDTSTLTITNAATLVAEMLTLSKGLLTDVSFI